jgi:hypothetical protein
MTVSLYLVNPASDFTTYFSAEVLAGSGWKPGAFVADLSTTTLAALAPATIDVSLCDENISPVDYENAADWIGITGKINQRGRMVAISERFRRRGKRVIMGGPLATLSPSTLRPYCDVLVCGEVEQIAAGLFADLEEGNPRAEYHGDRPDLAHSPLPRWQLYPNQQALMGAVQTSRGCPFECEFCDVIQYLGRKQRHKPIPAVLAELTALRDHGYQTVFLADDNFTAYRRRAKQLLEAITEWQGELHLDLVTQLSVDAARDPELLDMCAGAGLTEVFLGIETPNQESLLETKKRQNLHVDMLTQTAAFIERGIAVIGGMIVGFDADDRNIFSSQYEFAMASAIPIFSLGALVAPEATPLRARIAKEGRLVVDSPDVQAVPWTSNIQPLKMKREELQRGLQWLCNALYRPEAFTERMLRFIALFGRGRCSAASAVPPRRKLREIDSAAVDIAFGVRRLGDAENRMWHQIWNTAVRRPETVPFVVRMLFQYAQIRYMFSQSRYWDPYLTEPAATG